MVCVCADKIYAKLTYFEENKAFPFSRFALNVLK